MDLESLLGLALVLGLLSAAALARRHFAAGWQRNALSVAIVVLAMVAAFMLFFGLGALTRGPRHG
jgi:flagellar motor component MotA